MHRPSPVTRLATSFRHVLNRITGSRRRAKAAPMPVAGLRAEQLESRLMLSHGHPVLPDPVLPTAAGPAPLLLADDWYEENDFLLEAYHPGFGWEQTWLSEIDGFGVQADDDWYEIYVSPGYERLVVDLRFYDFDGDIDLAVFDAAGQLMAASESVTDDEWIDCVLPTSGTYYLAIYYGNAGNPYDLWWDDLVPPAADLSGANFDLAPEPLSAGQSFDLLFEVQNTGTADAPECFVSFFLSADPWFGDPEDVLLGSASLAELEAGGTTGALTTTLTLPDRGDPYWSGDGVYYVGMLVDSLDEVFEDDETNNSSTGLLLDYDDVALAGTSWRQFDWGVVDFLEDFGRATVRGDLYTLQPAGAGRLTIEAVFSHAAGDVDLALFDAGGNLLGTSTSYDDYERIDTVVGAAGDTYTLQVTGDNPRVDFRVTNLLLDEDNRLYVFGTAGDDTFEFIAGSPHEILVNGVFYPIDPAVTQWIAIAGALGEPGGEGSDRAVLTGSGGAETATLEPGLAQLAGDGYQVDVYDVVSVVVNGGGGHDVAQLFDSDGDDAFIARPGLATLTGDLFSLQAAGFAEVWADATAGGTDSARLYDSSADDLLTASPEGGAMSGPGYFAQATGFDTLLAIARYGGFDRAQLHDSPGDDTFVARSTYAKLRGDACYQFVKRFEQVEAYATGGGADRALLFGSAGSETFTATPEGSTLAGSGFAYSVFSFDVVYAFARGGGRDLAFLYDSPGDDVFVGRPRQGRLRGDGFNNCARFFDAVHAVGDAGGRDTAYFFDSPGNDTFVATPEVAKMVGNGYLNRARFFETVYARANAGGYDRAFLLDSALDDLLEAGSNWARLSSNNAELDFLYTVYAFEFVKARSTTGNDVRDLAPEADFLHPVGNWRP